MTTTSIDDAARRQRLRRFLIERRGRLKPGDVGLPAVGPRRCPGLRREEVADLVGVSATWYTLFEMARGERRPSVRLVERVGEALRMSAEDRLELLRLAVPEVARAATSLDTERERLAQRALGPARRIARQLARLRADDTAQRLVAGELQTAICGIADVAFFDAPVVDGIALPGDATARRKLFDGEAIDAGDGTAWCGIVADALLGIIVVRTRPTRSFGIDELMLLETVTAVLSIYRARAVA